VDTSDGLYLELDVKVVLGVASLSKDFTLPGGPYTFGNKTASSACSLPVAFQCPGECSAPCFHKDSTINYAGQGLITLEKTIPLTRFACTPTVLSHMLFSPLESL